MSTCFLEVVVPSIQSVYRELAERTIELLEQYVYGDEPLEMVAFAELLEDWLSAREIIKGLAGSSRPARR